MPNRTKNKLVSIAKRACFIASGLFLLFIMANWIFPFHYTVNYSQIITAQNGDVIHAFLADDDRWRMKAELEEITPELQKAIIAKEDKYFHWHFGVNPVAILRAFTNNLSSEKRTSGASTITMQVARLLEPKPRTYANKLLEMFRAFQLEWNLEKDEILQLYLNLVPYGGNVEGVKSASVLFFGRKPSQLSVAQITTLAIIPNRPTSLALGKHNDKVVKERNKWLKRFKLEGVFEANTITTALAEPLDAKRLSRPQLTPHLANWLHQIQPHKVEISTFIQPEIQARANQIVKNYADRQSVYGIHNAATLVIDNHTRQIIAYVGSDNFFDNQHAGQVDGVRAIRSPGSTLKPLLYGTGLDAGLFTPQTILQDVPTDFNGYAPENFNKKFSGKISVEQALAQSLNLPAVELIRELEVHKLINKLKKAGFQQVAKDEERLGLSLALGGCGASLFELVGLYGSLANEGKFQSLGITKDLSDTTKKQLISPSSAFMLTEVLTQLTRPDLPNGYEKSPSIPKIAWKTGTSHRRRDAWAIGYNQHFTIGVWLGNFSGKGVRELSGASKATPLLFELFNAIDVQLEERWNKMPDGLQFRYVCAETGDLPETFCENQVMDYFIPLVSPSRKCTHLRAVFISADEQISYCNTCLPTSNYKRKFYPNLSAEIITYFKTEKIPFVNIPLHNPDCTKLLSDNPPKITSLLEGREYLLIDGSDTELMLACQTSNDIQAVYWYVNNQFFQKAKPTEKIFFKPSLGKVKVSCTDDRGRNTDVYFEVKKG